MNLAPIALFVYNRPWHTQCTVEALLRNPEAAGSDLYIFSDHARDSHSENAVAEVRQYIRQIKGFRRVEVIEQQTNQGLANSIIGGVTNVCREYGKVIVLEDDLVASRHFLRFMNEALVFYKDHDEVAHVSGYTYPIETADLRDTYFLHLPMCWGWATWWRAWQRFDKNLDVMGKFDRKLRYRFDFDGSYGFWRQLKLNRVGQINTWFIFWYASVFLERRLCLFPRKSLIENIGHDGTGVHCGTNTDFGVALSEAEIKVEAVPIVASPEAYRRHVKYFRKIHKSIARRAVSKGMRMLRSLLK